MEVLKTMGKRCWDSFVLTECSSGREYTYQSNYLVYSREMRRLLETGEMNKFDLANIPEQRNECRQAWSDTAATIDWSGMIEDSIGRLLGSLERMEDIGGREVSHKNVCFEYRGIIAPSQNTSRRNFRLVDGSTVHFSVAKDQWIHTRKGRQLADR